ncbi:Vps51/Vps67-domain-containing protein [Phakopsora pachyrhizi]|uniref:Vacuolar protein sorting-associated protein 51 homolog n=1 Tax=Phakopsora pachyrhizi TaxID=170000 RepID=A0AAV0BIR9_PHAPC|nr:Vps51/Vps67-domain-containing protein [Phakopsora pachyrhizi]
MDQSEGHHSSKTSSASSTPSKSNNRLDHQSDRLPISLSKLTKSGDPVLAKRRARNLLRDYYGLNHSTVSTSQSSSSSKETNVEQVDNLQSDISPRSNSSNSSSRSRTEIRSLNADEGRGRDSISIDSPDFDPNAYFKKLIKDSSLKSLISTANGVISDIRELDGERQNLVYNHHHELVEASETIGKMKANAEKLDVTLDQLQNSFSSISQLLTTISSSKHEERRPEVDLKEEVDDDDDDDEIMTRGTKGSDDGPKSNGSGQNRQKGAFRPELHLFALMNLPIVLRGLMRAEDRGSADQLWGKWEPSLRCFEEVGVRGVKEIGNECREALRNSNSQRTKTSKNV